MSEESFEDFLHRMRRMRGHLDERGDVEPKRRQRRLAHNVWQMHCAVLGWKANKIAPRSTYLTLDGNLEVGVTIGTEAKQRLGLENEITQGPTDWLNVGDLTEGKRINFWQNHIDSPWLVKRNCVRWNAKSAGEGGSVSLNLDMLNALIAVPQSLEWKANDFLVDLPKYIALGSDQIQCDVLGYSCPDLSVIRELEKWGLMRQRVPTWEHDIDTDRLTLYIGMLGDTDWFGRADADPDFSEMPDSADYPAWIPIDLWRV